MRAGAQRSTEGRSQGPPDCRMTLLDRLGEPHRRFIEILCNDIEGRQGDGHAVGLSWWKRVDEFLRSSHVASSFSQSGGEAKRQRIRTECVRSLSIRDCFGEEAPGSKKNSLECRCWVELRIKIKSLVDLRFCFLVSVRPHQRNRK